MRIRNIFLLAAVLSLVVLMIPFATISADDSPVITMVNPSSGSPGQTLDGVVITGTQLTGATAVTFTRIGGASGVTATNVTVVSDTQVTATINIAADARPGKRNVTVTAGGVTSDPLISGFSVSSAGAAVVSLDAPANVTTGSGFYATINITGAVDLNGFETRLYFNPEVIQMAGLDGTLGSGSGIIDGVINGRTIPIINWSYQPTAGTPSGEIHIEGQ